MNFINNQLNFKKHLNEKVKKANCIILLIRNSFKYLDKSMFNLLYKSLVRPHLEYASEIWSPIYRVDIDCLERVQHRATRLVPSLAMLPYPERLKELQLPTLEYRRLRTDLMLLFKHSHNLINLDPNTHCPKCTHNQSMLAPSSSTRTRGHIHKFQIHHHQGIRHKFLTSRCLKTWNQLCPDTVNSTTINVFKNRLSKDHSMPDKFVPNL